MFQCFLQTVYSEGPGFAYWLWISISKAFPVSVPKLTAITAQTNNEDIQIPEAPPIFMQITYLMILLMKEPKRPTTKNPWPVKASFSGQQPKTVLLPWSDSTPCIEVGQGAVLLEPRLFAVPVNWACLALALPIRLGVIASASRQSSIVSGCLHPSHLSAASHWLLAIG